MWAAPTHTRSTAMKLDCGGRRVCNVNFYFDHYCSFSTMKTIKARLRNALLHGYHGYIGNHFKLSYKIATDGPDSLSDTIWKKRLILEAN